MECPNCGCQMLLNVSRVDGDDYQYECHACGKIVRVKERGK